MITIAWPPARLAAREEAALATAGEVALCGARNTLKASGHHKGLIILKEVVKEGTRSAVKVELHSDAFLGDEEQMGEGVQMGTVEVMMFAQVKYVNCAPEHGSGYGRLREHCVHTGKLSRESVNDAG